MLPQSLLQNEPIIFACYPRVSTDEQSATNLSLPSQIENCKAFIRHYPQAVLWDEYVLPDDESGMTLERPNLTVLRELICQQKINAIIVNSSDRLSRRPGHAEELFDEMFKYGVRLFIVMHGRELKLDNASDRQLLLLEMGANRYWWVMIREAMMRGQKTALERGSVAFGGNYTYGYRRVRNEHTRCIHQVVCYEEAAVVSQIFDWYVNGDEDGPVGTCKIQRQLKGIPTPIESGHQVKPEKMEQVRKRPAGEWSMSAIYRILHNPIYMGRYTQAEGSQYYETKTIDVPHIVDRTLWDAAQRKLELGKERSRRNGKLSETEFMLARRLTCSCGKAIHVSWSSDVKNRRQPKKYYYYECGTVKHHGTH
jgi:DNA invertase Pin-like site-specific DNA recombinase